LTEEQLEHVVGGSPWHRCPLPILRRENVQKK